MEGRADTQIIELTREFNEYIHSSSTQLLGELLYE